MVLSTWIWHVSFFYELALVDPFWHEVEHASFLFFGILFWFPVIQPWPTHSIWPRWAMIPYLLLADVQNTIFSAFFSFAPAVIYPIYAEVSPAFESIRFRIRLWRAASCGCRVRSSSSLPSRWSSGIS